MGEGKIGDERDEWLTRWMGGRREGWFGTLGVGRERGGMGSGRLGVGCGV